MKKLFTLVVFASLTVSSFSQQDPQFTQNMYNKLYTNPGYAGLNGMICTNILYRQQWLGFPGAPKTGLISIDALLGTQHGVGLSVASDGLGFEKNLFAKACYAFHIPVGAYGKLGIGAEIGMAQKSLDPKWVSTDPYVPDVAIPNGGVAATTYDIGFGLFFQNQNLYAGLSSTHLPQSVLKGTEFNFEMVRHYYVTAGYDVPISADFKLKPSIFVKSDAASTIFDINLSGMYQDKVWLGGSYRFTDAVAALLGFNYAPTNAKYNARIGFAYDFTTSELKNHSNNTWEVMVGFCFKIVTVPKVTQHQNPRFLL